MKYASPALIAYLENNSTFLMADLYQITLQTGQVYRWTDADVNLTYQGNVYTAAVDNGGEPVLERGEISNKRGLDVSTMDLTLFCGQSVQILGVNCTLAAHNGAFDQAEVQVVRVVMPTWGDCTTLGGTILFDGLVAAVDLGSTQVILHVASMLTLLTVQMPRALFLPACVNTFGDASCGISIAALTVSGAVTAGSTTTAIKGAPTKAAGYYQQGVLSFTSGACSGTSVAVNAYDGTTITPVTPLPAAPSVGDAFTVYPGCSKTMQACQTFWGSLSTALVAGGVYQITALGTTNWATAGAVGQSATTLSAGTVYTITSIGTTDFTLIGAASNTVGLSFTATGPDLTGGSGTAVGIGAIFTASGTASGTGTAWNMGFFRGCPFTPPAESGL
jgi:uncharacterized phage protein (TIGR02218 family)